MIVGLLLLLGCASGNQNSDVQESELPLQSESGSDEVETAEIPDENVQTQVELPDVVVVESEADLAVEDQPITVDMVDATVEEEAQTADAGDSEQVEQIVKAEEPAAVVENTTLQVNFIESAPKDRFVIENSGGCTLSEALVTIDLNDSAGGLIFDTTGEGAGVEVFQPFEIAEGQLELVSSGEVIDGDTALTVRIQSLQPGAQVGFTIDVDDTLVNSELGMIQVTGSEISGGAVLISTTGQADVSAVFGENSRAATQLACG